MAEVKRPIHFPEEALGCRSGDQSNWGVVAKRLTLSQADVLNCRSGGRSNLVAAKYQLRFRRETDWSCRGGPGIESAATGGVRTSAVDWQRDVRGHISGVCA